MHLQKTLKPPIKPKNIDQIHTKNPTNPITNHYLQHTVKSISPTANSLPHTALSISPTNNQLLITLPHKGFMFYPEMLY